MKEKLHSAAELIEDIDEVGMLPLLTTPEDLFGKDAYHPKRTAEESRIRIHEQLRKIMPDAPERLVERLMR